ncbi:MAG: hypothetical protein COT74_12805 [Bdellovibrionales bacterium CG10_big_fil_rev_8_21_14_0_10_45_34]|nr:MAG: hypothetical protein COT74_12805 [Bdellovibrionales bacterium CG10_big_fil_rev_8_21_14_0_10_45_34]
MKGFETTVYGKCILAGEHAVLRGSPAIAVPLKSRSLMVSFYPSDEDLEILAESELSSIPAHETSHIETVYSSVLSEALRALGKKSKEVRGKIKLKSDIPVGSGLGASAALCVSVTRMMEFFGWLSSTDTYEFARVLENRFHGESSGLDVAVALKAQPLKFVRGESIEVIHLNWLPKTFLSYSGARGLTSDCVAQVKKLFDQKKEEAIRIDQQMRNSVEQIEQALKLEQDKGFDLLCDGITGANDCFKSWGLFNGKLEEHADWVLKKGAIAVKPTGSGGGGHILSIWKSLPEGDFLSVL